MHLPLGEVSLFLGDFVLTRVELSVSFFPICAELRAPVTKHAELWVLFLENVVKIPKKSKGYAKVV